MSKILSQSNIYLRTREDDTVPAAENTKIHVKTKICKIYTIKGYRRVSLVQLEVTTRLRCQELEQLVVRELAGYCYVATLDPFPGFGTPARKTFMALLAVHLQTGH